MAGANERTRLYRRSHALWEETRSPNITLTESFQAYFNAISYELQPIRFSSFNAHKWTATYHVWNQHFKKILMKTLPYVLKKFIELLYNLSFRHWLWISGIIFYYIAVRIIHELLDAGPIVLILTILVVILKIGLGDDEGSENRVSAYSVFNRDFRSLLGSVNAEHLLQQHVGGAVNAAAAFAGAEENLNNQGGRIMGLQQPTAAPVEEQMNGDLTATADLHQQPIHKARKSGKKNRRRKLEQRREIQRQRQAAYDFEDNDVALQQVLQEQIMGGNNQAF